MVEYQGRGHDIEREEVGEKRKQVERFFAGVRGAVVMVETLHQLREKLCTEIRADDLIDGCCESCMLCIL